jgi:hypothetical protein
VIDQDPAACPTLPLILRRANVSGQGGSWQHEDYDVCDGAKCVGRIFLDANGTWFWGVSFELTRRKNYSHTATLDEAKAFRVAYLDWQAENA